MAKTGSAGKVVQDRRRRTRQRSSAEEKIRIVLEGLRGEESIAIPVSPRGLNPNLYYRLIATPLPNRLIGHGNAPLGHGLFRISKTQTEPVVQPVGATDNLGRKPVAVVAGGLAGHQPTLLGATST